MYANSLHAGLERIEEVHSHLANTALFNCAIVGLPNVVASVYRTVDKGRRNVMVLHVAAYAVIVLAAIFNKRLPFHFRGNVRSIE